MLDGPERAVVDPPGFDLTEVDVVHRGEDAEQLSIGAGQGADRDAVELVVGLRLQTVVAMDALALVQDGEVVGDGGEVHDAGR